MTEMEWEATAVALFTEVEILGSIVHERIEETKPAGLSEADLSVLMLLTKAEGVGMTMASLVWTLESSLGDPDAVTRALAVRGLVTIVPDEAEEKLNITMLGTNTIAVALKELMPGFTPALQDIPHDALQSALHTIREIRRTLDHLP